MVSDAPECGVLGVSWGKGPAPHPPLGATLKTCPPPRACGHAPRPAELPLLGGRGPCPAGLVSAGPPLVSGRLRPGSHVPGELGGPRWVRPRPALQCVLSEPVCTALFPAGRLR